MGDKLPFTAIRLYQTPNPPQKKQCIELRGETHCLILKVLDLTNFEPVQLRAEGGEGRVRARAAGDEGDVVGELLRDKVPVEEEDDQGPAAEEEPGAVDKHDGCAGAPEHREAVQDVRGYMAVDLEGDWYFLVMEYCDMGNLYSMQSKLTNKVFSFEEALNIFNQVLRGVEVIHRNKIVHRDLKL